MKMFKQVLMTACAVVNVSGKDVGWTWDYRQCPAIRSCFDNDTKFYIPKEECTGKPNKLTDNLPCGHEVYEYRCLGDTSQPLNLKGYDLDQFQQSPLNGRAYRRIGCKRGWKNEADEEISLKCYSNKLKMAKKMNFRTMKAKGLVCKPTKLVKLEKTICRTKIRGDDHFVEASDEETASQKCMQEVPREKNALMIRKSTHTMNKYYCYWNEVQKIEGLKQASKLFCPKKWRVQFFKKDL